MCARYLVVTQMNILTFEPINKNKNIVKLVSWASLQSLLSIKRKKDDDTTLILTWKDNTRRVNHLSLVKSCANPTELPNRKDLRKFLSWRMPLSVYS